MSESNVRPLTFMKPCQKACIVALKGGMEFQSLLVSMGLHIGKEVEILLPCQRCNGPAIVAAGETRLALGYDMASNIIVAADAV